LDTHARALAAGVRLHGCSVHWVSPGVDEGAIIAQAAVPVLPGDNEAVLAARVLAQEHSLYPAALAMVVGGGAMLPGGDGALACGWAP
jgi:folate-dependent phosphoribosylglycinamide formyltransferase PurN